MTKTFKLKLDWQGNCVLKMKKRGEKKKKTVVLGPSHLNEEHTYMYMYTYLHDKRMPDSCARSNVGLEDVAQLLDGLMVLKHGDVLRTHGVKTSS